MQFFITMFNHYILLFFMFIYKRFNIETLEDRYHKDKQNTNLMNTVKCEFNNTQDFEQVKTHLITNIINDVSNKYNITTESILNGSNNVFTIHFKESTIYIQFNHYYMGGTIMFKLLNNIFCSIPPTILKTNPFIGLTNLPFYAYDMMQLTKRPFTNTTIQQTHYLHETNIVTSTKRYYTYYSTLSKVYQSLKMERPMIVALSIGFEERTNIHNNVGIIIIKFEISDTIETLEQKIKDAKYQAYVSNFILNCPLPNIRNFELRNYVDCVLTSIYVHTDIDVKIAWNCIRPPTEQMYVGTTSIIKSDNSMNLNMVFNTCSSNYNNCHDCVDNFFD
jgi:hypothetical protein